MSLPEFVAPLVPSVVPADTLNKKDLYAHLQEFHPSQVGVYRGVTSKSGKDQMEALHARLHEQYDYTQAQAALMTGERGQYWVDNPIQPAEGEKPFAPYRDQVHEHLVVPVGVPTEEERDILNAVTDGSLGRVLSVTERKALERLIDNDFASLRNEMRAYADEMLAARLENVESEFADKRKEAERLRKAAIKAITKANEEIKKVLNQAKEAGVTITGSPAQTAAAFSDEHLDDITKAVVEGQTEANKKVHAEHKADLQTALHTLERQRLASQRLVLLAGISPEGQRLLDTIPDAKALMVNAAQDRATKALTAGEGNS